MWRIQRSLQAFLAAVLLGCFMIMQLNPIRTDAADAPSLIISQLKISSSNGQFVTLYNATGTALDASKYQLQYFNNYDLSKATSSKLIALSGMIPPHGYLMLSDDSQLLCYRLTVDAVSLGLSSTAGMLEVLAFTQAGPGGPVSASPQDYVAWSKSAAPGAQTLPGNVATFLQRQPVNTSGGWITVQPAADDPCRLVSAQTGGNITADNSSQLLLPTEPPAIIAPEAKSSAGSTPYLPTEDAGLMSPVVNELLPNPVGTGNDAADEFIELYNPNGREFDLTGFGLQAGLTTLHTFVFPAGTKLAPQGFTAFYAKTTGLSLSNTSGQVKLLDPFGKTISTAEPYSNAKDGVSWALAKGKWYWTTGPTPGKANTIHQPPAKTSTTKSVARKATKGTATTASGQGGTALRPKSEDPAVSPIHLKVLALVIGAALLYGAYEYRADVANHLYRFKRHIRDRHADGT